MIAYRIADRRYPIYDGTGAMLHGARWNSPGRPMVYAAETFAGAMLEVLAHTELGRIPRTHQVIRIEMPDTLLETVEAAAVPGWMAPDLLASRRFGDLWLQQERSAALLVPGLATGGRERNILINPLHRDIAMIKAGDPEPVAWDPRLFRHRS